MSIEQDMEIIKMKLDFILDNLHKLYKDLIPIIVEYNKKMENK